MRTPREHKLLSEIRTCADKIIRKTAGKTLADYKADEDLRLAVERLFTILGEAAMRLERSEPQLALQIPNLRGPIAFRNFLIHVYDSIEDEKVWEIITSDLLLLRSDVTRLIEGQPSA